VFEVFAGGGELFRAVWYQADEVLGCDWEQYLDERTVYVGDNRRVLRAAGMGLSHYNIFDLDAYGSPWEQAIILADRRGLKAGETLGVALTVGDGLKLKMGGMPHAVRELAGFRRGVPTAGRNQGEILDRTLAGLERRMGGRIVHRWEAVRPGQSQMRYLGLVLEGE
jgi:hypothetical protein